MPAQTREWRRDTVPRRGTTRPHPLTPADPESRIGAANFSVDLVRPAPARSLSGPLPAHGRPRSHAADRRLDRVRTAPGREARVVLPRSDPPLLADQPPLRRHFPEHRKPGRGEKVRIARVTTDTLLRVPDEPWRPHP